MSIFVVLPIYFRSNDAMKMNDLAIQTNDPSDFEIRDMTFNSNLIATIEPVKFLNKEACVIGINGQFMTSPFTQKDVQDILDQIAVDEYFSMINPN